MSSFQKRRLQIQTWFLLLTFTQTLVGSSHRFCSSIFLTNDIIKNSPSTPPPQFPISLPNPINGRKLTFSTFFKVESSYVSELNLFGITMKQAPGEIPNQNVQDLVRVSLKRDIIRANSSDGIRVNFAKDFSTREYSLLKSRLRLNEWYFLVLAFDFESKQAYFSLVDFENSGRNKVFELFKGLNLNIDVPQEFSFGKSFFLLTNFKRRLE
jgi:hypothetical protein